MKSKILTLSAGILFMLALATALQSYKLPAHRSGGDSGTAFAEFFGHVTLVQAYETGNYKGFHALVTLRDKPGGTIAILSTSEKLMSICRSALETGNLMAFWGQKLTTAPAPLGGTWSVDVYETNSIMIYNKK